MKLVLFLKIFCIVQLFNAFMDLMRWFIFDWYVPSWSIAVVMLFNVVIILVLSEKYINEEEPLISVEGE